MITFKCPRCEQSVTVPDSLDGQTTRCPSCAGPVRVSAATPKIVQYTPDDRDEEDDSGGIDWGKQAYNLFIGICCLVVAIIVIMALRQR